MWEIVAKQPTGGSSLTLTWKSPLSEPFTSPPFPQAHLFTQALSQGIKATQQGLPESQFGGPSFLCAVSLVLEHKLNKTCPEISLVVPPDFHLGNPRTLNTGNRTLEGNPRKPTSTEVNSLPRVTELEWVTTGFNSQTLTTVLYNFLKTALSALFFCSRIRLIPHNSVFHFCPASHPLTPHSSCLALFLALQGPKKPIRNTEGETLCSM